MTYRNIVFTLNNYSDVEYQNLLNHPLFKYVVIGKEVGESGTHLQGYAELTTQMRFNRIKKEIHPSFQYGVTGYKKDEKFLIPYSMLNKKKIPTKMSCFK